MTTSGARELPRFALLAHAVAGRRITVVGGASERAHTDGETIVVPDGPREDVLRDTVAVQAALLAAGSFDPWVMARLTGRRALRLRYLTLEAVRARTLLPPSTRARLAGIYDGPPPGSALASLHRAAGRREPVPEAPAWLGTIKPVVVLRANPTGGAPAEDDRTGTSRPEELRELDDEEDSESSRILQLLAGPLANPLATMMQKLLGAGRTPGDDQGGGQDMPVGVSRHGPTSPRATAVTSPAPVAGPLGGTPIGHRYPEWDHHRGRYRPDWCSVAEYDPPPGRSGNPTGTAVDPALRRQLGRLGLTHGRCRRQPTGDSLDLTALVELVVDHAAGHAGDPRVHECHRRTAHDLGVLVLLDVTGSTGESATGGRVFDHQRELAARLTVALDDLGDRVAAYGFFSRGRDAVRFLRVKDFDDRYDLGTQERLAAGSTEWVDGPLTRAVREGGICYLDEIVEARQDATVAVHSLTDHRRELHLERLGGVRLTAAAGFLLVTSYNPGYQSVLKDLKVSTRQRMVAIELDFPPPEVEVQILLRESAADRPAAEALVRLGAAIRRVKDAGLREAASTRTLIAAAALMAEGLSFRSATVAAVAGPLTDDRQLRDGLVTLIEAHAPAT